MLKFSQKDARWANLGIGHTMKEYGCLVTSIAIITGKTPDRILNALNAAGCFDDQGKLLWEKAVHALGLKDYEYLSGKTKITKPIICETDHYKSEGYPQHFFVMLPNGECIDPIDGLQKKNKYNIVSQRLLT